MKTYDAIVIGLGGMGAAATCHLAKRGLRVLGLERFDIAHDRGSSHGETRIIRKAYFEHPDYVPLLHRAYDLWEALESDCGRRLFERCGLVLAGPPDGPIIAGVRRAAVEHDLTLENVPRIEAAERFPGLRFNDDAAVLFEADAGFLRVEDCTQAHVDQAIRSGAEIRTGARVRSWSADDRGVIVKTESDELAAGSLVICGGAWSGELLQSLSLPLTVRRQVVLWFETIDGRYRADRGCPVFGIDTGDRFLYGFPEINAGEIKTADHTTGDIVPAPDAIDRDCHAADEAPIRAFAAAHLPGVSSTVRRSSVCMYTMTPDEHFIVDRHPDHANVAFAAGFSGHGYKFAPIVGSVLADLVLDGRTTEPVEFLSVRRPGLAAPL